MVLTAALSVATSALALNIGDKAPKTDVKMKNVDGQEVSIASVAGPKGTLVVFSCNHCPFAKAWEGRIAEIFDSAVSEMDKYKRKRLYDQWQEIVMDQCTKVYMPLREVIIGVNNKFGNIHLTRYLGLGSDLLYNIEEIYIKQPTIQK